LGRGIWTVTTTATITHQQKTTRELTYSSIRAQDCHVAWSPEIIDVALEEFAGYSFGDLVNSPAFRQRCESILTSVYRFPGLAVDTNALGNAAKDPRSPLLNAYISRELGRCRKKLRVFFNLEQMAECRSILLERYVDIMSRYRVGRESGECVVAYRCTNYCGAHIKGAWEPIKALLFSAKRYDSIDECESDHEVETRNPLDDHAFRAYWQDQRGWPQEELRDVLERAVNKVTQSSRHSAELRALLAGDFSPASVAVALGRTPSWVSGCLVDRFLADVREKLGEGGIHSRLAGKTDFRTIRGRFQRCFE
jgi:hypothetical protein